MPLLAPHLLAENLRETNARLTLWLDSLVVGSSFASSSSSSSSSSSGSLSSSSSASQSSALPSAQARPATPQQMAALLSELMRAGEWLRSLPNASQRDAAIEQELSEYRKNVERLRDLLPSIHGALLQERGRLEQERSRVESAAEWARGSRQTF